MLSETVTQGRTFFPKVEKVCGRFLIRFYLMVQQRRRKCLTEEEGMVQQRRRKWMTGEGNGAAEKQMTD